MIPVGLYEKALPAEWSWERRLAATAEAGYDFAEISIDETDERLARLDWAATERAALRRAIANSGVRILTMCLSGHRKYPLGSHSPELRRRSLEIFRKAIDFAVEWGWGSCRCRGTMSPTSRMTLIPRPTCWRGCARGPNGPARHA